MFCFSVSGSFLVSNTIYAKFKMFSTRLLAICFAGCEVWKDDLIEQDAQWIRRRRKGADYFLFGLFINVCAGKLI